jgi:hypothetical protein
MKKQEIMKATAKSTMLVGSLKNGMMQINMGETVEIIKVTKKSFYVCKNGLTKQISKDLFY